MVEKVPIMVYLVPSILREKNGPDFISIVKEE